jgi:hypothetical protein
MARNKNQNYSISGGTTNLLILTAENFVFKKPVDENEAIFFEELTEQLKEFAVESTNISEQTALHKILYSLAYEQLYLNLYDDLDWIADINDFTKYVIELFNEIGATVPQEFYSNNEELIYVARDKYRQYFIDNLWYFVNSAFAYLWYRKSFLYEFNLKMSFSLRTKITRATYFPKWLKDVIINREKGICHYCQTMIISPAYSNQSYDIDHMIPIDKWGTNDPTNLVLSCPPCNNKKRANFFIIPDTFAWPRVP